MCRPYGAFWGIGDSFFASDIPPLRGCLKVDGLFLRTGPRLRSGTAEITITQSSVPVKGPSAPLGHRFRRPSEAEVIITLKQLGPRAKSRGGCRKDFVLLFRCVNIFDVNI